jgi:hypothetical protein
MKTGPRAATRFYEGKPCKTCGATLRYVSTQNCVACQCHNAANKSDEALYRPLGMPYGVQPAYSRWISAPVIEEAA